MKIPKVQDEFKALKFIATKKNNGYMTCLKSIIGKDTVDSFQRCGFIKSGFTRKHQTFSITELGREYFNGIK